MNEADGWLTRYEETHGDLAYPGVYWASVPMIVSRGLMPMFCGIQMNLKNLDRLLQDSLGDGKGRL